MCVGRPPKWGPARLPSHRSSRPEEAFFLPKKNRRPRGVIAMRTLVSLLAWLAIRAGAKIARPRWIRAPIAGAVPGIAVLGQTVGPDRAGRLVPVPEDALEPEVGRSLGAHWALWAAVGLIVLLLAAGYLRRRWRAPGAPRPARFAWLVWGRDGGRK